MTAVAKLKHGLKAALAHALYAVGVLQIWQFIALRRKAVVLMYHRVLTKDEQDQTGSHPAIIVDRDTFARQMAFLRKSFTVLSLEEFADRMERQESFPDSSCLITFDDGWRDTCTNALPILERHGLPAVVFLPVHFIGTNRVFWQEALAHLVVQAIMTVRADPGRRARIHALLVSLQIEAALDLTGEDLRAEIIQLIRRAKGTTMAVIDAAVGDLSKELGVQADALSAHDGFLEWEQVEAMSRRGIAFGGHGAEHLLLDRISLDEARREIHRALEVTNSRIKESVASFSYPNGYVNSEVVGLVKESGYRLAFITRRGFVSCEDDRYTVRRLNIHEGVTHSVPMFLARIVGLF